jgi:hypothetical protein
LKRCELVEIQCKGLYLAVRGKVNPDNWTVEVNGEVLRVDAERSVEVNGEVLHLLVNNSFGLSRDDLVKIYPALAQSRSKPKRTDDADFNRLEARVQRTVLMLDDLEDNGTLLTGIMKERLAEMISSPRAPISVRTLFTAEAYRKNHPR